MGNDAERQDKHAIDAKRWYCPRCGNRYLASWGQVVQMQRLNEKTDVVDTVYVRAEVPPWDIEDIRALYHEDHMQAGIRTPEELYDSLHQVAPAKTPFVYDDVPTTMWNIGESTTQTFTRVKDLAVLGLMPSWTWEEIYNCVGKEPPPRKKKKLQQKIAETQQRFRSTAALGTVAEHPA